MNYKKLTATIVGSIIVAVGGYFGIDPVITAKIAALLGTYIVGQGIADFGKEKAKVEAGL